MSQVGRTAISALNQLRAPSQFASNEGVNQVSRTVTAVPLEMAPEPEIRSILNLIRTNQDEMGKLLISLIETIRPIMSTPQTARDEEVTTPSASSPLGEELAVINSLIVMYSKIIRYAIEDIRL